MENIIKNLLQIGEDFAVTTAAMGQLPTPIADSLEVKIPKKVAKDSNGEEKDIKVHAT